MKNIVIFGAPGSGKGTYSDEIVAKYGMGHISTGDVLRGEIKNGTELGKVAKGYIDNGQLIPDELMIDILAKTYDALPQGTGVIFDGFPRTIAQAEALDAMLTEFGGKVDAVLSLTLPDELVYERILHRAQIEGRKDDTDRSIIENRIATYHDKTEPLITYYKGHGNYREIEGNDTIENVFAALCGILDE